MNHHVVKMDIAIRQINISLLLLEETVLQTKDERNHPDFCRQQKARLCDVMELAGVFYTCDRILVLNAESS